MKKKLSTKLKSMISADKISSLEEKINHYSLLYLKRLQKLIECFSTLLLDKEIKLKKVRKNNLIIKLNIY